MERELVFNAQSTMADILGRRDRENESCEPVRPSGKALGW